MRTALITGACGFIGRNLIQELSSHGYATVAIDRGENDPFRDLADTDYISCDLTSKSCADIHIPRQCDVLYHLAWIGVSPETRSDVDMQLKNVDACVNAIRIAEKNGIKDVVFIGSTLEYCYNGTPISETSLPTPANVYGSTKVATRFLCEQMCVSASINFKYAVITSIYGAGRDDNSVISYCIKSLLSGISPDLSKSTQIWDFVHISDAVKALRLIGETDDKNAFYSVGTGENKPLKYYIEILKELISPDTKINYGVKPYQNGKIPSSAIDLSALSEKTGYTPKYKFAEGIKEVVSYYKSLSK